MTTLKDLLDLAEKANTFGFKPEEVQVEFKSSGATIALLDANACVSATTKGAKPTLTINFTRTNVPLEYGGR